MKRSCQRQTTGLDKPERRMISLVPQPSPVASMTLARAHMLLRAVAIPDDRLQSAAILRCDGDDDPCSHAEA